MGTVYIVFNPKNVKNRKLKAGNKDLLKKRTVEIYVEKKEEADKEENKSKVKKVSKKKEYFETKVKTRIESPNHFRNDPAKNPVEQGIYVPAKKKNYTLMERDKLLQQMIRDPKLYQECIGFFNYNQAETNMVCRLLAEHKAMLTIAGDCIQIVCGEDAWLIPLMYNKRKIELWHNNYVRCLAGNRYIWKGFHQQCLRENTISEALEFIMGYNYERFHNSEEGVQ